MPGRRERIEEEAIAWHVRLRGGAADEWERFTLWLEADPLHAEVYDEVALADDALGALPAAPPRPLLPVREEAPPPRRHGRRAFLGWGIAAALVGTLGYVSLAPREDLYEVVTRPGERRVLSLADGSRIDLNGASRIVLDRERIRFARLTQGEALFTIAREPAHPFEVEAGADEIRVLGTVFNVWLSPDSVEVGVSEGAVLFNPDGEAVRLNAGNAVRKSEGRYSAGPTDAAAIGSWRAARLVYSSATVARIAADLSRNIGVPVEASPEVAGRPFSGVIVLDGDRDRLFLRVSALLALDARRSGDGWLLTASSGAAR